LTIETIKGNALLLEQIRAHVVGPEVEWLALIGDHTRNDLFQSRLGRTLCTLRWEWLTNWRPSKRNDSYFRADRMHVVALEVGVVDTEHLANGTTLSFRAD
jgi:hypothetical protein